MAMITDIEDYFAQGCGRCERFQTADCSTQLWFDGLAALRRICLSAGLVETVKWGHPCYMYAGRNVAIIGAFRGDFRLTFFNAGLMKDPAGILEHQGPNTRFPDMVRFTSAQQVQSLEPTLMNYLSEACGYAEAGLTEPPDTRELAMPAELVEALAADPELSQAWDALTPGRRKGYLLNLDSAKRAQTRHDRIEKFRPKIMAGKGPMDR